MPAPHMAPPRWTSGDPLVAATTYAQRYADAEEAHDRAAGLTQAASAAARPARVEGMTAVCLRYWQAQRDAIDAEFGGTE